jgi:DNA-binding NtrC family response regulator
MGRGERAREAHVRVVLGRTSQRVHELTGAAAVIGRNEKCDVQVEDTRISRQHVRIEFGAAGWSLTDLGSRNGGFVDGRPFQPNETVALADGAIIRLGDSLLSFRQSRSDDDGAAISDAFPGVSPVAAQVRRRIAILATAPAHVLILGETGTGKERVARAIAACTDGRPFVTQNCAELSRELARSELFGHVRGAFSGATHTKPGLVDLAGDGVLFLDELGELALDVQGDLLRFLEDGSYRPLGSVELKRSSARVVAATNVDLDRAVASNQFRRDLVARLRATNAPLKLPPLRDRRDDIPAWTEMFLAEVGCTVDEPWAVGALECLLLYPWLENLRELRGVVRGLVAEGAIPPFSTGALPARICAHRTSLRDSTPPSDPDDALIHMPEPTRDAIEAALRETQGRVRTAAQQLGVDRRKLYRLCERFGIALEEHRRTTQVKEED